MYQGRLAGRRLRPGGREQQRTVAVSNPNITGPTQRENVLREILIIFRVFILLELCLKYATMNE
jgi:hypothetical protein